MRDAGSRAPYDLDPGLARRFAVEMSAECGIAVEAVASLAASFPHCEIGVTCTPARAALLAAGDVRPGQFIAAVGADSEGKQELDPRILLRARVVADVAGQAAHMGELQHALAAGLMTMDDLHAELGQVIAGLRPGRTSDEEIFVFDSTGTALQDVAAAAVVYERARALHRGTEVSLSGVAA